jgi:hypothetical protein
MAVVQRDKRNIHMLTDIHNSQVESNFCDEKEMLQSDTLWEIIIIPMGDTDDGDRMINSHSNQLLHMNTHAHTHTKNSLQCSFTDYWSIIHLLHAFM